MPVRNIFGNIFWSYRIKPSQDDNNDFQNMWAKCQSQTKSHSISFYAA